MKILALAGLAGALLAPPALAQSVALKGPDGRTAILSAADLAAMPHVSLTLNQHGKVLTYEGVALGDIVARVGAASGKAIHGPEMATVIKVSARDGYQVVLGLAETDPGTRADKVILADRADGAPLKEDGPFRLVVGGDLRPARSARMVERIEVIRMSDAGPAAAPAEHKH